MEDIKMSQLSKSRQLSVFRVESSRFLLFYSLYFLDRTNIGFAALHMNDAIGITQTILV